MIVYQIFKYGIMEHRSKNGGRVIVREVGDNIVEILAKTNKKKILQDNTIKIVKKNVKNRLYDRN